MERAGKRCLVGLVCTVFTVGLAWGQFGVLKAKTAKAAEGVVLIEVQPLARFLEATALVNTSAKTVALSKDKTSLTMTVDSKSAKLNGQAKTLPAAPKLVEGKVLVPMVFCAQTFGGHIKKASNPKQVQLCTSSKCTLVALPQ